MLDQINTTLYDNFVHAQEQLQMGKLLCQACVGTPARR